MKPGQAKGALGYLYRGFETVTYVMNTKAEIIQAIDDYRNGRMEQIHA